MESSCPPRLQRELLEQPVRLVRVVALPLARSADLVVLHKLDSRVYCRIFCSHRRLYIHVDHVSITCYNLHMRSLFLTEVVKATTPLSAGGLSVRNIRIHLATVLLYTLTYSRPSFSQFRLVHTSWNRLAVSCYLLSRVSPFFVEVI